MQSLLEVIPENVKFYRKKSGLSQLKLAYQLEMAPSYLAEIERGTQYPSLKVIERIASYFKIEPYQLLMPNHLEETKKKTIEEERILRSLKESIDSLIENMLNKRACV